MTWHLQLANFKDGYAVELPGHPYGAGCRSIEEYADAVARYIHDKRVAKPVLVGHSMGGAIAIELALRGLTLAGLVLVGTGARLRVRKEFLLVIRNSYEEACKLIASWSVSRSSDQIIATRLVDEMMKVKSEVTYGDFLACDRFDKMNEVQRISCPTLIVCGSDDRMTPPKYSQYLHENISNSKLVLIPDAGHVVMLEKARAFNELVEAFVS